MGNSCAVGIVYVVGSIALCTGAVCLLTTLGFTTIGVAAGSLAALAMAFFGNVKSGSVISRATSMGMKS